MKVIGAGFGHTGNLSPKVALEELCFGPCYRMVELFVKPEHVWFWDEAADRVVQPEPWSSPPSGWPAACPKDRSARRRPIR